MNSVFITGATGFIGGHLVKHLTENNYAPFFVTREQLGDPFSLDSWLRVIEASKSETVIHLIAKTHTFDAGDPKALKSYRHINVDITKVLLEACKVMGIKKFLYLSSIKAVGEETTLDEPFTEESPCRPVDCYGISKREAEELVLEYSNVIDTVILRPPLIYGPGVKGNFLRLLKLVDKRYPLPFGSLNNARSMLYVGNLVQAIVTCLGSDKATGQIFHIADNETPSTKELVLEIGRALEKRTCLIPVPISVLRMASSLTGRDREISKLTNSLVLSTEKITKTIGWETGYSFRSGVDRTCQWFIDGRKALR